MTTAAFDPRNLDRYSKPKSLLHFQWGDDTKVYRYCLVEIIDEKILIQQLNVKRKNKD